MFREMVNEDLAFANEMLSRINYSAADLFKDSYKNGSIYKNYVYEEENNRGIFTIIEGESYYSFQISFDHDVSEYEVIKFIEDEFQSLLTIRNTKDIYFNFNGYNAALINYFMNYGLERDSLGFEFYISADSDKVKALLDFDIRQDITPKEFEEEHTLEYLKLLDNAFRKQQIECKEEQDGYCKNLEINITWLKELNANHNFQAFWVKTQLVGLYIVRDNYIDTIAVHPDYERKGAGSEILKYCLKDRIYNMKFNDVYLVTYYQNRKAQRFYLKNGFKIRGFYCENTYKK
jgi:ribosomal protein S18 acetylase RimI-like enzyme